MRGDIIADDGPRLATVIAAEHLVGGDIKPCRGVRAQDERGIPVPFVSIFAFDRFGPDLDRFFALFIITENIAILVSRIDYVGIAGFNGLPEAVTTQCGDPLEARHPFATGVPAWPAHAVVILCAAIDPVERFGIIDIDPVKLGDGQIGPEEIIFPGIVGFVNTPVAADDKMLGIIGIYPHGMIIHVACLVSY